MSDASQGQDWWLGTDGKWYPPMAPQQPSDVAAAAAPEAPLTDSPTPTYRPIAENLNGPNLNRQARWVLFGVLVAAAAALLFSMDQSNREDEIDFSEDVVSMPEDDIEITECGGYEIGNASLTITNNSGQRADYLVAVHFLNDAGNKMGEATVISNDVEAGQVAVEDTSGSVSGDFTDCVLVDVERYPSG